MNILLVNPNVTEAVTEVIAQEARRCASAGTTIQSATAPFGTQYIANRAEAAIAGHAVLDAIASHQVGCDAAIIAAFGDPGLAAAKELFDIPVVGITEAALLTAWMLGRRIAIVCMTARLRTWYQECAAEHGLDSRLVSVRALEHPPQDISKAREQATEQMIALCNDAVNQDDAEVIIVGGGPLAGLAHEIAHMVPVPTLDGVTCAVHMAQALVAISPGTPKRGSFARPPAKPSHGLAADLAARIEHLPAP